jgi:hypothetical protein
MGGDENSAVDVEKFLSGVRKVQRTFNCPVTILHHLGKDASKGARGHSSLRNNTAYQIIVSKHDEPDQQPVHTIWVERQKDLEFGQTYRFRLKVLEVGRDDDDEPITSCVVEMLDDADFEKMDEPKRIGKLNQLILDVTREFYTGNVRWPSISEVTTLVREGNDRRKNVVVDAIEHLVEKGGLDERDGQLIVPGRLPNTVDLSE